MKTDATLALLELHSVAQAEQMQILQHNNLVPKLFLIPVASQLSSVHPHPNDSFLRISCLPSFAQAVASASNAFLSLESSYLPCHPPQKGFPVSPGRIHRCPPSCHAHTALLSRHGRLVYSALMWARLLKAGMGSYLSQHPPCLWI